ncbi:TonB-dependent receptor [Sphingomonas astaxanthinifaciens]|uniref:TonB-dependent receptor n=1 Tax=Sphingomonas astaxanthinifaciens DSM 22298 TaxID=1123267 RepID=A0ABQ5Z5L5_9SPHN|nr:TonB-dependent receptor [Sphingomonas astaxanthinifaciens]GLR46666.1 TonB-dependent receptor [Sphingomonas astaxanthinifaciens DSM 22298]
MKSHHLLHSAAWLAGLTLAFPAAAQAQAAADSTAAAEATAQPADPTPAPAPSDNAGDIVVTATKQSLSLAKTPAAISAIRSDEIMPGGIQNIGDLQTVVPNVSIGDQFGVNRTFVRGIGLTSIDLGADGAVAFLQDGAIISRPSAQLSGFYDLDQIEVLRGPQGTLYGRGATGGAINLVVKKPTTTPEGYARLTIGNYQSRVLEAAVGGPIADDKLMVRVAGKYEKRDGYGKNLFTGRDIDDRDAYAFRGVLVSRLTPDVKLTLIGDHSREKDANYAFHYFGPSIVPDAALPHKLIGGQSIIDYYAARGEKPNFRNIYSDEEPLNRRRGTGVTGILDFNLGDVAIKSTTAYRKFRRFNRDDLDVSDVWMYGRNDYTEDSKSFSQELTGNYSAGNVTLLGGLMYFREKLFGEVRVPTVNLGVLFGLPADIFDDGFYLQRGTVKTKAYGAFLQGSYQVTPELKITAGARYNYERRAGSGFFRFDAIGVNVPTDKKKGWSAITPKFLVEYEPDADTLLYGTITRGFKSGVINVGSANAVIDPEFVWNYEAGFKRKLFDRRVLLSGAVFYYDYKDLQVGFVNAQSIVETVNAASARNYGAELEVQGKVTDQLNLNAYGAYLNARFTDFCNGYYGAAVPRPGISYKACSSDPALADLSGKRLPNAPSFSFGGGFDYTVPLGRSKIVADADMSYQSKVYFTEFNNYDAEQKGYALFNAGLTYYTPGERFMVRGWVKNIGDKYVVANNIITAATFAYVRVGSLMPPRTYGLTLGTKF